MQVELTEIENIHGKSSMRQDTQDELNPERDPASKSTKKSWYEKLMVFKPLGLETFDN